MLGGADISLLRADQRAAMGIRRTFQNLKLFGEMSCLLNVMVGLHGHLKASVLDGVVGTRRHRDEQAWARAQALQALSMVGLRETADRSAASLAYGHRRLLEIARALVASPQVLLLDEPAQGMNPTESMRLVGLIQRINATGVTVVLVEHHMPVVMAACHRITVLNYGRKIAEDVPASIQRDAQVIAAYLGAAPQEAMEDAHA
jgi:ABC-type branched-subunit amino acid transport system ATPase component